MSFVETQLFSRKNLRVSIVRVSERGSTPVKPNNYMSLYLTPNAFITSDMFEIFHQLFAQSEGVMERFYSILLDGLYIAFDFNF